MVNLDGYKSLKQVQSCSGIDSGQVLHSSYHSYHFFFGHEYTLYFLCPSDTS